MRVSVTSYTKGAATSWSEKEEGGRHDVCAFQHTLLLAVQGGLHVVQRPSLPWLSAC